MDSRTALAAVCGSPDAWPACLWLGTPCCIPGGGREGGREGGKEGGKEEGEGEGGREGGRERERGRGLEIHMKKRRREGKKGGSGSRMEGEGGRNEEGHIDPCHN